MANVRDGFEPYLPSTTDERAPRWSAPRDRAHTRRSVTESKRPRRVWQPDLPKKRRSPTPLGELVAPARETFAKRAGVAIDRETWRRAVGDRIAARTEPGWLKGSVLTVLAASSAWAQELSLLSEDIKRRLAQHGLELRGIRFLVQGGAGYRHDAHKLSKVSREALPDELRARLRGVDDAELAQAIAEAAGFSLAHSRAEQGKRKPPLSARPHAPALRDAAARSARSGRGSKRGPGGS